MSVNGQDTAATASTGDPEAALREYVIDWLARAIVRRLLAEDRERRAAVGDEGGRNA